VQFIEQKHDKPWLLFLSQLEPHRQNDVDAFVPPKRYEGKYVDPYIPEDLRKLPGNWRSRIPGYYGCVQAIDDCVGTLVAALEKTGHIDDSVVLFFSDHGCTFRTRFGEYKRSPHDSSIRVPFVIAGPGFGQSAVINEVVSLVDLTPTLLDAAGIRPPSRMRGKPLGPLAPDPDARKAWDSTAYFQISQSICGRGIRTREWCYCAFDPSVKHGNAEHSEHYQDFALYSIASDPNEMLNLVGRPEYKDIADQLREELRKRIIAAGEPEPTITLILYYA
jgi:arylsulfatase A-like enzyme